MSSVDSFLILVKIYQLKTASDIKKQSMYLQIQKNGDKTKEQSC